MSRPDRRTFAAVERSFSVRVDAYMGPDPLPWAWRCYAPHHGLLSAGAGGAARTHADAIAALEQHVRTEHPGEAS